MSEQQTGRDSAVRPRVWWSPSKGLIEQVPPRWPGEEPRFVRTSDRQVVQIPDDAVELMPTDEPAADVVDAVAGALAGVTLAIGPNAAANIAAGQREILLSGSERRNIALTAIRAHRDLYVKRDGDLP